MAPPELEELKKRVGRKLTKRKKEGHHATLDFPERFNDGDDAEEDVTQPQAGHGMYMNQSLFGMITAAGSQVDFNARFEGQSSDDDDNSPDHPSPSPSHGTGTESPKAESDTKPSTATRHRRKLSDHRLLRSLPSLGLKPKSSRSSDKSKLRPSALPEEKDDVAPVSPKIQVTRTDSAQSIPRGRPVMSQMLEAKAELSQRASFDMPRQSMDQGETGGDEDTGASSLAIRLMQIFGFEKPEEVIEEYPCWLMKSVLLQGYMYITAKHICFYAYLPKKTEEVAKSGYLSKRGQKNPKYNRYWFKLKGDVLSYFTDPAELYFPSGNIDLRYGISAGLTDKEKSKDGTYFTVVTHEKKYSFKADSVPSAKEWVKSLQKVIFRSHNDGDSVKISLPIENVLDVEEAQVVEFAETCKIRVIDNDETYAMDEYFFSFFNFGKEALSVLKILVEDTTAKQIAETEVLLQPSALNTGPRNSQSGSGRNSLTLSRRKPSIAPIDTTTPPPALGENVRATLSPLMPPGNLPGLSPKTSGEFSRSDLRASFDGTRRRSQEISRFGRRHADLSRLNDGGGGNRSVSADRKSFSRSRLHETRASDKQDSSESYVQSMEEPDSSAQPVSADDDTQGSASQILSGSDALFKPTIPRSASATRRRNNDRATGKIELKQSPTQGAAAFSDRPHPHHAATTGSMDDSDASQADQPATPTLQSLVKAGAFPLQRAAGFAGYLNRTSKRMSTLLATESMGYVEKVSGMWKGGKKHYDEPAGAGLEDDITDDDEEAGLTTRDRFRDHFALPASEKLQATYFGYLHRVLPLYGKIYISDRSFCFRSMLPGTRTKLILPLKDIENVDKEKGFRFGYSGLVIVIKGHEELFFEFGQADTRDDCAVTLLQNLETMRYLKESGLLSIEENEVNEAAIAEHKALQEARKDSHTEHDTKLPTSAESAPGDAPPIMFDDPRASILNFKPTESLRITCLTIGSRGDVQPYIALCKGLMAEGHKVKIATHHEFKGWVEGHGIAFAPVEGDPAELMRICVENGMFTYSFLKEASSTFRTWIDELCSSAWIACQDSDILIESPSAMAGVHIAEALAIPYFRAFTMPWTRTRAYPHAFAVPEHKMGGAYNYITYVMFDNVFWKAIAGQINRWRKNELGLQRTNLEKMQPNKVPFLYNFSPSVVVPPLDYSDWIRVTGYWFLDEGIKWEPPKELTDFIAKARSDGKKLVYIGFGSIVVSDSAALTRTIISSVQKADVRCILSKGWSDRLDKKGSTEPEVPLPEELLSIKSAPHDWLFKQIDAAAHHGGAGTTGASLRAGLPTIIKPFFGDQFFFGNRVEDLGVGICLKKLNVSVFSRALWEATHSERMVVKAKVLGEQIRKENGVDTAIQSIYRDLEYAKSLIKNPDGKNPVDDTAEDIEESWTFIGDDNDPELIKRIHDWEGMTQHAAGRVSVDVGGSRRTSVDLMSSKSLGSRVVNAGGSPIVRQSIERSRLAA